MPPDQIDNIGRWPDEGGIANGIECAHDLVQLSRDRFGAPATSSHLRKELFIAKGKLAQELVHVRQLPIVFIEHRRNVHDLPGDDQLGNDIDRDSKPSGKNADIAQDVVGQTEHDGRLSHPI